jgi:hypothetical protein
MTELVERDYVVGSDTAQKIPPGGVVTKCVDCKRHVLIDAKQVRDLGRRPSAVVLCAICADPVLQKKVADERGLIQKVIGKDATPEQREKVIQDQLIKRIEEMAKQISPYELRSHFDFDPPEVADLVESAREELGDRYSWKWTNDTGTPVMITQRAPEPNGLPRQMMILNGENFQIEMPKPDAFAAGFHAKRPVRDNPQA